jgi:hypothetical protein
MGNFLRSVMVVTTQVYIKVSGQGVCRGPSPRAVLADGAACSLVSEKLQRKRRSPPLK